VNDNKLNAFAQSVAAQIIPSKSSLPESDYILGINKTGLYCDTERIEISASTRFANDVAPNNRLNKIAKAFQYPKKRRTYHPKKNCNNAYFWCAPRSTNAAIYRNQRRI